MIRRSEKITNKKGYLWLVMLLLLLLPVVSPVNSQTTIKDDLGRTVVITKSERIVSIGPSCTELLYALGLGGRIVGVDVYSDYPPEARSKQKISNWWSPNPEEVLALSPDIVFYSVGSSIAVENLEKAGLTVVALRPLSIEDIFKDIKLIGEVTGKSKEAEDLVFSLQARINAVEDKLSSITKKPKVYMEFWYPPPWTFGSGSWGNQIIKMAGGVNVFGDVASPGAKTTDEEVIARNPDVIILLYGAMYKASADDVKKRPGWNMISAVANNAIYQLDENLFVRPGPRLVDGLEILAKVLHPEAFGVNSTFAFSLDTSALRQGVQSFNISDGIQAEITVMKALSNSSLIVTLPVSGPSPPEGVKQIRYLSISSSAPEGLTMILRVYYSQEEIQRLAIAEDSLKIYKWDQKGNRWVALTSAVNKDGRYVEALVTGTGSFMLAGKPLPPIWEQPIPLWLFISSLLVCIAASAAIGAYFGLRSGRKHATG
ncbi:MAG: ABC transporter substrate-binding protein [Candidatus Methanodesulfokora washburnensis]|jgi:iron complex transport system substrate-binding protein